MPFRRALDGILYVLRTGCQWKALPKEYGSGSTAHRRFQQWVNEGVFQKLWVRLLQRYDETKGIKWKWQSLDSSSVKSPLGEKTGPNPTDRGKLGTKRHQLTDQRGTPLSAVITGANTHDMKAAMETLDSIATQRPPPGPYHRQNLCLDKGYDCPEIQAGVIERKYVPHMRHRGELEDPVKRYKPKRRVVERSASWLNRFRRLLIGWEKKAQNYLGLVQLACCITVYRRTILG